MSLGLHRIASCAWATLVLLGVCCAPALADDVLIPTAQTTSVATTISKSKRMMVAVNIANRGPYSFIIDTAAERSVIARELASDLALTVSSHASLVSMTASREVAVVQIPDLSFLPGQKHTLPAFLLNAEDIGASGVLGIDALRGQRIVLDFAGQTLSVEPGASRQAALERNEIVVNARRRLGQLVLAECTINGTPVDVVIDSGAQVSLGNEALRRLLTAKGKFQTITLQSVTGESFTADYTRASELLIGNAQFLGMPIAFADIHFFRKMKLTRTPALLLGMDALQMFARVSVDFKKTEVRFLFPTTIAPPDRPEAGASTQNLSRARFSQ
jgi:predicted aspartyl protease